MSDRLRPNLTRLVGTLDVDNQDFDRFDRQCAEMKEHGYYGVYFNNIFFTIEDVNYNCSDEDILYREDNCLIVRRSESDLQQVKNILLKHTLLMPSAHFLNMLPEPGYAPESIFETHKKILDMAQFMGAERVTTHIGGIAVPTAVNAKERPTPAEKLENKEISYAEYVELVREIYGDDKIIPDSLIVYKHLCEEAKVRGITVTIETACTELYRINLKPELIIDFIHDIGLDNLGICIDSGHCHLNGLDTAEIIRKCGPYFLETHFHDNFGKKDRHNPVGIGTINWLEIIKAMDEIDYQGEITFEQGDYLTNYNNWMMFAKQVERD